MSLTFMISMRCWPLTTRSIYRVFDMAPGLGHSRFVVWQSNTIFCTWLYHHETMCHIHSWPLYMTFTFDLNIKIVFSPWIFVWARWSLLGIPNLAHRWITMRQQIVYIHYLCMTLTFDIYFGGGFYLVSSWNSQIQKI